MNNTTSPKFFNANGDRTAYALACGYVQRKHDGSETVELYQECGALHVRHIHDNGGIDHDSWQVFDHLTQARAEFRKQCARYLTAAA